ncbi:MAG: DUF87 domain-containing protein [Candidatus Aminicenantes bacterium]|jgi:hypothetical protein
MTDKIISKDHLDYLQRSGVPLADLPADASMTRAEDQSRLLWHIRGVGQIDKTPKHPQKQEKESRTPGEELIIGLHGYKVPMAFFVHGSKTGVEVQWGTWERVRGVSDIGKISNHRQEILKTSLDAMYPDITLCPARYKRLNFPKVGFALGIPTAVPSNSIDGSTALDRLIRAMVNTNWACLVLAEPAEENAVSQLRGDLIEETRRIQSAADTKQAPPPLITHYEELLGVSLQNLTMGMAVGTWRVAVYLMGDEFSYYRLASLWRGLSSGEKSFPEPVRNWSFPAAGEWAEHWILPDVPATAGPGFYRHPLAYQTLLTSQQLAAYCHLPQIETPGFAITTVPDFDTVSQQVSSNEAVTLGQVVKHRRLVEQTYDIELAKLSKHVFVAGVTGAGKSNTIFHLLKEITKKNIPFLVIEPAKTEYRALLDDPSLKGKLQVFTCGNEQVSPFRLNPFEVLPGTPVSVHIDLLRSVFAASFGLWTPLPQVLEQCLHEIYKDRGWDIMNNKNTRLDNSDNPYAAFPTLTDLAAKVDQVTKSLGYEERVTSNMRAALLNRITSLRTGGKGRLFDVQKSLPMSTLLSHPTILELETIGDDDDKAFLMGLILIRMVFYRRQQEQSEGLQHLLVIEEAHRLLANVSPGGPQEEANPRGKAVETFSNLLSEIRAYGQGVLVADQVPVKLAPDVIKNTNLKIAHRIVAADDRTALAGAMAMDERRTQSLGILSTGEAILFSEGDDAPLLVKMAYAKVDSEPLSDVQVKEIMIKSPVFGDGTLLRREQCANECQDATELCALVQNIVEESPFQNTFSRIVLSIVHDAAAMDRLWPDLVVHVQARRLPGVKELNLWACISSHAAYWYAHRKGAQEKWTYSQTHNVAGALEMAFLEKAKTDQAQLECENLQKLLLSLSQRTFDPYPACASICKGQPSLCLYRQDAANLIERGSFSSAWTAAVERDKENGNNNQTLNVCMDAGYELMEFADEDWPEEKMKENHGAARCVSLCFAQQKLIHDGKLSPRKAVKTIKELIKEVSHE